MADVSQLKARIDAEFSAADERRKGLQRQQLEQLQERENRLQALDKLLAELRAGWQPRLEALAERFGDRVQVTPAVSPGAREATFAFKSPVAQVRLRFCASTDTDVTRLQLSYDLEVLPLLMEFERHSEISFPLDQVNRVQLTQWLDDRIVGFVRTYVALHENEHYLKDLMVEDPVAHVRFPKFAAGATLSVGTQTLYFVSDASCREYERLQSRL